MNSFLIAGGAVVSASGLSTDTSVLIQGAKIVEVGPSCDLAGRAPGTTIDARGAIVAPGFIDMHIHGSAGFDTMDATPSALARMAEFISSHGVTGFLPTVMSTPIEQMLAATHAAAQAAQADINMHGEHSEHDRPRKGAQVLGVNVEGPFLSPDFKGAQPETGIVGPDPAVLHRILEAGGGHVRVMTIAPEMPGAIEIVKALASQGVLASVGHSGACYDEVRDAIHAGLRLVTHTYNGMRGLHHREPGVVGAALVHSELTCEVIADGIHVHPAAAKLVAQAKGPGGTVLMTDAMRAAWQTWRDDPDGPYAKASPEARRRADRVLMADTARAFSLAAQKDVALSEARRRTAAEASLATAERAASMYARDDALFTSAAADAADQAARLKLGRLIANPGEADPEKLVFKTEDGAALYAAVRADALDRLRHGRARTLARDAGVAGNEADAASGIAAAARVAETLPPDLRADALAELETVR
ncbi:MAG TPA: N-acetylglucosamine-6-phosphate deacetylase, partial [Bacillota bacterium]|nr:N-acetylglucosamine-6-phosphate deacetylase [Bacillota bacterium]